MEKTFKTRTEFSKDDWITPDYFYNQLDSEFHFTLDPASDKINHKTSKFYTINENGLNQSWEGEKVFVNPPFNEKNKWIEKCYKESLKKYTTIVLLTPVTTEIQAWYDFVWNNKADEIRFCYKRINFEIMNADYSTINIIESRLKELHEDFVINIYANKEKTAKITYSKLKNMGILIINNKPEIMKIEDKKKAIEMINNEIALLNNPKDMPKLKENESFDGATFPPCLIIYRNPRKYADTKVSCFKHR